MSAGTGALAGGHRLRAGTPSATLALGVVLLVLITALGGLILWQGYRSALSAAEERAQLSAHVVAAHVKWMVTAADQALRRLDDSLGPDPDLGDVTAARNAASGLPMGLHYALYNAEGDLEVTDAPGSPGSVNVADREFFETLETGEPLPISRLTKDPLTGRLGFMVVRRIMRSGALVGAAVVFVPEATVASFWASLDLGSNSTVSIIRSDGWLVARFPQLKETMDVSNAPVFNGDLAGQAQGYFESDSLLSDGLARIVGFWRVEDFPLIAIASIARDHALEPFWNGLELRLIVGLPLLIALAGAFYWIARLQWRDQQVRLELERSLERNQALFREIHHRVKNNLQAVSSLVQLQPIAPELRTAMANRIAAMVGLHEHLYRTDQFDRVELDEYLARLIDDLKRSYQSRAEIEAQLTPVAVGRDQAMPIGLIVNEVLSNALKHAFPEDRTGKIAVRLAPGQEPDTLELTISDDGIGYASDSSRPGMGSRLIDGFVAQLGGAHTIRSSEGTVFTLTCPVRLEQEIA